MNIKNKTKKDASKMDINEIIFNAAEDAVDGYELYLRDRITSLQLAKIMKTLKNLLVEDNSDE
jgi:hypothetical protein|tara:strand:+ start:228 stop:416 length:189 start_codon:yes stop_codon:yes gene_type:complete